MSVASVGSAHCNKHESRMNSLLQESLLSSKNIAEAAIIKDGIVKAKTRNFHLRDGELLAIENGFTGVKLRETGFTVFGESYEVIRADSLAIYGKADKKGALCQRTKEYLLIATFDATMYASSAIEALERLADYFLSKDR